MEEERERAVGEDGRRGGKMRKGREQADKKLRMGRKEQLRKREGGILKENKVKR